MAELLLVLGTASGLAQMATSSSTLGSKMGLVVYSLGLNFFCNSVSFVLLTRLEPSEGVNLTSLVSS